MVKYLNFHNSSFALKLLFNVNDKVIVKSFSFVFIKIVKNYYLVLVGNPNNIYIYIDECLLDFL